MALDEMDGYIIQTALEKSGQNITVAAWALGITREASEKSSTWCMV